MGFGRNIFDDDNDYDRIAREQNRMSREVQNMQEQMERSNQRFREELLRRDEENRKRLQELEDAYRKNREQLNRTEQEILRLRKEKSQAEDQKIKDLQNQREELKKRNQSIEKEKEKDNRENILSQQEMQRSKEYVLDLKNLIRDAVEKSDRTKLQEIKEGIYRHLMVFQNTLTQGNMPQRDFKQNLEKIIIILQEMGDFFYKESDFKEAQELYEKIRDYRTDKISDELNLKLLKVYFKLGKFTACKDILENLKECSFSESSQAAKKELFSEVFMLKLKIFTELNNKESLENLIEGEMESFIFKDENRKYRDELLSILDFYIVEGENGHEKLWTFYASLLLRFGKYDKLQNLIGKYDKFSKRDFYQGVLYLKAKKNQEAYEIFQEQKNSFWGMVYFIRSSFESSKEPDILIIDKVLEELKGNVSSFSNKAEVLLNLNNRRDLIKLQYEFLGYKLVYLIEKRSENLYEFYQEIKNILENEEYRESSQLWGAMLKLAEYYKKIDNNNYSQIEKFIKENLTTAEIEGYLTNGDRVEIEIEKDYKIGELRYDRTIFPFYEEFSCETIVSHEKKIYLLGTEEVINKKKFGLKEKEIKMDKYLGDNYEHFLKIDNYLIKESYVEMVIENYEKNFYEMIDVLSTLTFREKLGQALTMVEAFKNLEKSQTILNSLSKSEFVHSEDKYKFKLINYNKSFSEGSLTSTGSSQAKEKKLYKNPDKISERNLQSNIYILGLYFYHLFYDMYIYDDIPQSTKSISLMEKLQDEEFIDMDIVKDCRYRWHNQDLKNQKTKILKVPKNKNVTEKISKLMEKMLSKINSERPSLKEIEEIIRRETEDFNYKKIIPKYIKSSEINEFISSLKNIEVKTRDEKYLRLIENSSFDDKLNEDILIATGEEENYSLTLAGENIKVLYFPKESNNLEKEEKNQKENIAIEEELEENTEEKFPLKENEINLFIQKHLMDRENTEFEFWYMTNDYMENFTAGKSQILDNDYLKMCREIIKNRDLKFSPISLRSNFNFQNFQDFIKLIMEKEMQCQEN